MSVPRGRIAAIYATLGGVSCLALGALVALTTGSVGGASTLLIAGGGLAGVGVSDYVQAQKAGEPGRPADMSRLAWLWSARWYLKAIPIAPWALWLAALAT